LEHIFHAVTVSEETGSETLTTATFSKTLEKLGAVAERTVFVGCDLAREIAVANTAGLVTVRMKTGTNRMSTPRDAGEKPVYEIDKLSDLFVILPPEKASK
jgi:FMN phosphatase YigB (HAD superfamily)